MALGLALTALPAQAAGPSPTGMFGSRECAGRVRYGGGVFGGYNYLLAGYENYGSLWTGGVDLIAIKKLTFRDKSKGPGYRDCRDNLGVRFSFAYAPVAVPEGNYNVSQDYLSVYFTVFYRFGRGEVADSPSGWFPFVGGGMGLAFDRTSANSPASGELSGTASMLTLNLVGGFLGPEVFKNVRFVPEVRVNALALARGFNFQTAGLVSLAYWPDTRLPEVLQ